MAGKVAAGNPHLRVCTPGSETTPLSQIPLHDTAYGCMWPVGSNEGCTSMCDHRLQSKLDQERDASGRLKQQLSSSKGVARAYACTTCTAMCIGFSCPLSPTTNPVAPADMVEQLHAQLEEGRRQGADSKAASSKTDALCQQLRDKLEGLQRAAAAEQRSLQVCTHITEVWEEWPDAQVCTWHLCGA